MNADAIQHSAEADTNAASTTPAFPPPPVADSGRVRFGGQAPLFPPAIADDGKIRVGGQAPLFLPAVIADAGLFRIGGQSPTF